MGETKFTKGPWSWSGHSIVLVDCKPLVAFVNSAVDLKDDTEDYANAALTSCAPDMYEMLDKISDGLLEAGGIGNCALAKEIEELLAKARGES